MPDFVPYQEPDVVTILIYSSFLLLLVLINHLLDTFLYCGLIGQILIGVAFGTPGAQWLSVEFETVVTKFGYLGLILLVYEGGLSTSFQTLRRNILLSTLIAITGIASPIALSFTLQPLANATPLQAFTAGAALCSTSLGTTFALLSASDLSQTRLGIVLSTAAMLDDLVGLIMVQVISNLAITSNSFRPVFVIRPLFVSVAFAVLVPCCLWTGSKLLTLIRQSRNGGVKRVTDLILESERVKFCAQTLSLLGLVTAASYAGTSNLFSAYIAGAAASWWDGEGISPMLGASTAIRDERANWSADDVLNTNDSDSTQTVDTHAQSPATGLQIYKKHYLPTVNSVLKPLFFASIGFSIPIKEMFSGAVIWRGLIYAVLMLLGKLLCSLWLLRIPWPRRICGQETFALSSLTLSVNRMMCRRPKADAAEICITNKTVRALTKEPVPAKLLDTSDVVGENCSKRRDASVTSLPFVQRPSAPVSQAEQTARPVEADDVRSLHNLPVSRYPAMIIGCAMTARGEIGFLISSLAEGTGIFRSSTNTDVASGTSELFLIITWAIMLCTFFGPLCTGILVKRMKASQMSRDFRSRDVLGPWGFVGI